MKLFRIRLKAAVAYLDGHTTSEPTGRITQLKSQAAIHIQQLGTEKNRIDGILQKGPFFRHRFFFAVQADHKRGNLVGRFPKIGTVLTEFPW